MTVNESGLNLIRSFEGLMLSSYQDQGGVWTIGYGHTGPDVKAAQRITESEADRLLRLDIGRFENGLCGLVEENHTTSNQFSAMTSLAFNIGLHRFELSSVLRFHRNCAYGKAANAFLLWQNIGGKHSDGLERRREAERALYAA